MALFNWARARLVQLGDLGNPSVMGMMVVQMHLEEFGFLEDAALVAADSYVAPNGLVRT